MDDLLTTPPAPSVLAAAVILDELAALEVTDVVCCPGSRSAPLAYAAARAETAGRIRLHIRLDERQAGFFALGLAKVTSRAVAVVTTSGTAVANLAPAMAEARHGQVPLIACTADRPSTLVGTGANQTTDQLGIFGTIPLSCLRIAASDQAPAAWRSTIRRAVVAAEGRLTRRPGPVQINIELSEPLLGDPGNLPAGVPFHVEPADPPRAVRLDPGPRTVIVAGDLPPAVGRQWAQQAERCQVPLLAEPSSNARRGQAAISAYRLLLPGFAPLIERVIVVGHPTLSRPVTALLGRADAEIIAVDPSGQWCDPGWAVSQVVPAATLGIGDPAWMGRWAAADRTLRARLDAEAWSGPVVAARLLSALGEADTLVLGASNPIRDADLAPINQHSPTIYANRGLAGIDGTIATACGVAVGCDRPVTALLGDLTAWHDIASLASPALERGGDLKLVVVDDGGGSLFASLEYGAPRSQIGDLADWFERLFAVPMAPDLAAVVRGFGLPLTQPDSPSELAAALSAPPGGIQVVHVRIGRDQRAAADKRLTGWGRDAVRMTS